MSANPIFRVELRGYVPAPCERPRQGKNGVFYSPTSKHEQQLAAVLRSSANAQRFQCPIKTQAALEVHIFCRKRRGDIDNQAKTIMDALQKAGLLINDNQVTELYARVAIADEDERTVLTLEEIPL